MKFSFLFSSWSSSSETSACSRTRTTTRRNHVARLAVLFLVLLAAIGAAAQTTNALSEAEVHGRQLAQKLLDQRPAENFTNAGVLQIRHGDGSRTNYSLQCEVAVTATNWTATYTSSAMEPWRETFSVVHADGQPDRLLHYAASVVSRRVLSGNDYSPFADSDFWLCDLGLEFFHWPDQKILRGETMRNRFCKVLESTNPNPSPDGYSRVVSWIDNETLGIVQAKAYDAKGKLLKEFYPKDFKKDASGQWQVGTMEMDNIQTGSRTTLKFETKAK